ncbi:MAG TPA: hypothetical protein PKE20_02185, partial [Promineifilum sp.]|nr:hypothetical protein [Promineifilum sp.]
AGTILLRNIRTTGAPESAPTAAGPVVVVTVAPATGVDSSPRATSTAAPVAGAGYPPPAATAAAYPAPGLPPAGAPRCAIKPDRYVQIWTDKQAEDDDVCENTEVVLTGDQVWLLSTPGEARRMSAVLRWGFCYQDDFVRVQSVADPNQVGWILAEALAECQ